MVTLFLEQLKLQQKPHSLLERGWVLKVKQVWTGIERGHGAEACL